MNFTFLDTLVLICYCLLVFAVAFYASRKKSGAEDYFLAGRGVGWFAVGASIFASNISSEHFIGLAGSGFASGFGVANFEIQATFIVLLLGYLFAPFYLRAGIFTVPAFIEKRYNNASRWYLTIVSILAYVATKISVTLFAGSLLLKSVLGWDVYTSSIILVLITGVYTIAGGLKAVIYTELLQTFVLIAGAIGLTVTGINELGGLTELQSVVPADHWNLFKPADHGDYPWTGIVFGLPILAIWYWCTDQFIVQRVLSAHNIDHAMSGSIFAGYLKLLPMFIMVLPGIVAYGLYEKGMLPGVETPNDAYPALITNILPIGIRGIVIASLLAALMSSLASCFNSGSTLFTFDIYKKIKPEVTDKQLVTVGRLATLAMVLFGIMWIPFIELIGSGQIFVYLQSVQAYVSPPITAVFLLGLFWSRGNGKAAIIVLITGFFLGAFRFTIEVMNKNGVLESNFLKTLASVNFLNLCTFIFLFCCALFVIISLLTPKPSHEKVKGITFKYVAESEIEVIESPVWKRRNLIAAIGLILVTIFIYVIFW
ncbi:MAG: sodium:solute symporter [Bacteroidota bacterium]